MSSGPSLAFSLPTAAQAPLTVLLILATAVWVGGIVAIYVVVKVAHATLGTTERVTFFRGLGRAYGPVGGAALVIALATGAVLAAARPWNGPLTASAVVAAVLVAVTAAGVAQARRMTRLRQAALREPGSPRLTTKVRQGARNAAALRASIATLSLVLLALGVVVAVLSDAATYEETGCGTTRSTLTLTSWQNGRPPRRAARPPRLARRRQRRCWR